MKLARHKKERKKTVSAQSYKQREANEPLAEIYGKLFLELIVYSYNRDDFVGPYHSAFPNVAVSSTLHESGGNDTVVLGPRMS